MSTHKNRLLQKFLESKKYLIYTTHSDQFLILLNQFVVNFVRFFSLFFQLLKMLKRSITTTTHQFRIFFHCHLLLHSIFEVAHIEPDTSFSMELGNMEKTSKFVLDTWVLPFPDLSSPPAPAFHQCNWTAQSFLFYARLFVLELRFQVEKLAPKLPFIRWFQL